MPPTGSNDLDLCVRRPDYRKGRGSREFVLQNWVSRAVSRPKRDEFCPQETSFHPLLTSLAASAKSLFFV